MHEPRQHRKGERGQDPHRHQRIADLGRVPAEFLHHEERPRRRQRIVRKLRQHQNADQSEDHRITADRDERTDRIGAPQLEGAALRLAAAIRSSTRSPANSPVGDRHGRGHEEERRTGAEMTSDDTADRRAEHEADAERGTGEPGNSPRVSPAD